MPKFIVTVRLDTLKRTIPDEIYDSLRSKKSGYIRSRQQHPGPLMPYKMLDDSDCVYSFSNTATLLGKCGPCPTRQKRDGEVTRHRVILVLMLPCQEAILFRTML